MGTAVVMISLMQVASTGVVAAGGIEQRMLDDEGDRARLRAGVRALVELLADRRVAAAVASISCDDRGTPAWRLGALGDAELDEWMLTHLADYVHAAGTCAMAAGEAAGTGVADAGEGAVVDAECRVIGRSGLRVCDASVLPDLPRANTNLTTWAVAEELARRFDRGR